MPNKDGTGPNGQGPMTGRWMGNCNNGWGQMISSDDNRWGFFGGFRRFFRGFGARQWRGRWMWLWKGRGRWQGGFGQGAGRWMWRGRS